MWVACSQLSLSSIPLSLPPLASMNSTAVASSDASLIFAECGLHLTPLLLILIPAAIDVGILFMLGSSATLRWFHWPLIAKQLVGACLACAAVIRFWMVGATRLSFFACSAVLDLEVSPVLKLFAALMIVCRLHDVGLYSRSGVQPSCLVGFALVLLLAVVLFASMILSVQWLIGILSFVMVGLPYLWIPLAAIVIMLALLGRSLSIQDSKQAQEQEDKKMEQQRKTSVQMAEGTTGTDVGVPPVSSDAVSVSVVPVPSDGVTVPSPAAASGSSSPSLPVSQIYLSFKLCGYLLYVLSFPSLMGMSYLGWMLQRQSYTDSLTLLWDQRPTLHDYTLRQWQELIRWI